MMNKFQFVALLVAVFALLVLAGCTDTPEQTKAWYMQHDMERHERVSVCRNNAREQASADCQNALAAQAEISVFGK